MLAEWANTITAEEVNREAASLLAFASYHGSEAEVLADAEQHPERYSTIGPTRSTSVVACFPAFTDPSGESIGEPAPSAPQTLESVHYSLCLNVFTIDSAGSGDSIV